MRSVRQQQQQYGQSNRHSISVSAWGPGVGLWCLGSAAEEAATMHHGGTGLVPGHPFKSLFVLKSKLVVFNSGGGWWNERSMQ
jgi:hypothetical protein